ncbi:MAG TPA: NADH:flavin oxidoreductase [Actinotalea sp.]|nr:NADH:flavin oxidoreductase [Actinotalea sp.]
MTSPFDPLSFAHGPAMTNRLMLAPLTNTQSHPDGTLSDEEHRWLAMRAQGGFGLTMTAAAHVQAVGQGFPGQLGVFGDEHLPGLTRLAADLNAAGTVSYVQLHHAGTRAVAALLAEPPVAPSDDPATGARALTTAEVEQLTVDFVAAARRAQVAGFHGVELHGAHGYLIGQFLSPSLNRRTDRYGGSLENRSRLLLDLVAGVRDACGPDLALGVRLSADRFGILTEEMVEVAEQLVDTGEVDLLDMSLWDVRREATDGPLAGRRLVDLFAGIERGGVRLAVAGQLRRPSDVREVLDLGVDVAVLGRAAILQHDFPRRLAADPAFAPRSAPASSDVLAEEGVSPAFLGYLKERFADLVAR